MLPLGDQAPSTTKPRRACDGCTACCKTHGITELQKPAGRWCRHCKPGEGCAVYSERPAECISFACLWLMGFGPDGIRPDRSRVVLDAPRLTVRGSEISAISMHELAPGSIAAPAGREIERNLLANGLVVVHVLSQFSPTRFKFIVPPELRGRVSIEELQAALEAGDQATAGP